MIQLQTYHHEQFPPALNWQAVSFMRVEWPFINGGMLRETYPAGLSPVHFALVDDDLLLSYAAAFRLNLHHAGMEYEMDCLGNVFTFPGSRRKGYGRRVVDQVTRHILTGSRDVAALFCAPTLADFYARSGWEPMHGSTTLLAGDGKPEVLDALLMMLFISERGRAGRHAFETLPLHVPFPW